MREAEEIGESSRKIPSLPMWSESSREAKTEAEKVS